MLAHETVYDGVREIKEEIGIDVSFEELVPLGIIEYHQTKEDFIDKELANVFLYESAHSFDDFTLQPEEVSGMVKVALNDFEELWTGAEDKVNIKGFEVNHEGRRMMIDRYVGRDEFVPHDLSYYESIIRLVRKTSLNENEAPPKRFEFWRGFFFFLKRTLSTSTCIFPDQLQSIGSFCLSSIRKNP